jgi:hypothetical protein
LQACGSGTLRLSRKIPAAFWRGEFKDARIYGKGRKGRTCPLWKETLKAVRMYFGATLYDLSTAQRLFRVYFSEETEDFSPYVLDVLLAANCFAGNLGESRRRNFSREHLTVLKGMLRIVAIG